MAERYMKPAMATQQLVHLDRAQVCRRAIAGKSATSQKNSSSSR
jgi:hypothetical protein